MTQTAELLAELYAGVDRLTSGDVVRRAVAADAPAGVVALLQAVPEGEYAIDEIADAVQVRPTPDAGDGRWPQLGIQPSTLADDDLFRELGQLHRTRNDTLRHGSDDALMQHDRRTVELEGEYLRRFPDREVDPHRLRP